MSAEHSAPRDPRAALASACAALKIFPLPGVVVLPGTPTPLHVFEPRYRALVEDALAGDRILAIPTLVSEAGAREARAAVHPVAGVGIIEAEERYPDGRFDVVVRGLARVRLEEELERGKPYRELRAALLDDVYPPGGPAALAADQDAVRQLVYELVGVLPVESGAPKLAEAVSQLRDPSALADLVAAAAVSEPEARLRILETLEVTRRLELVKQELAGVILMLSQGRTPRA